MSKSTIDLTTLKGSFERYFNDLDFYKDNKPTEKSLVHLFEFAGPIGSGKTATADAVAEMLAQCKFVKQTGYHIFKLNEDIISEENKKAIAEFYEGQKDGSELEKVICGNRMQMLIDSLNVALSKEEPSIIISDRSIEEDIQFIEYLMSRSSDWDVSDKLYTIITNINNFLETINLTRTRIIHNILYLNPGLDTAIERIRHRGRPNEQQINYTTLVELTTNPKCFQNGNVRVIENGSLNVEETALMAYERIIWEVAPLRKCHNIPLHRMLVSFYGVPGSGKTYFLEKIKEKMSQFGHDAECEPDFDAVIKDGSDDDEMVEAQRKVYEENNGRLTPDEMQSWIDNRRLNDFDDLLSDHFCAFVFTDVGPLTSEIFRKSTGCKPVLSDNYFYWFSDVGGGDFDIFVNVVVEPSGGLSEVRNHIKERGRPGEYEYFTEEKLDEINELIREQINTQPNGRTSNFGSAYHTFVVCKNDYSDESVNNMFHSVMETMRNAVIGYSASR